MTATCSKPDTSSASGQETELKQNLVGYSNSFSEDHEVIDITGVSSDSEHCFKNPVSDSELKSLGGKTFTASTDRKIAWAKKLFDDWKKARNDFNERGSIWVNLDDDEVNKSDLSTALCQFLSEVQHSDGHDYPGNTLYSIVVMLQLHFEKRGHVLKLINNPEFVKVKNTLDNLMKKQVAERVSSSTKAADPFSVEAEEQFWQQNILGSEDADQLRDTVMYLIGLTFALRSSKEHRSLRCPPYNPQIRVLQNSQGEWYLEYKEDPQSKSNQGGLNSRKYEPKIVRAYGHKNPLRNIVVLYHKYVMLLPGKPKSDALYKYAMVKSRRTPSCWYVNKPIGINSLSKTVSRLMFDSRFSGCFTNHSLRVSAATHMFQSRVKEQIVKEKTGHCSDAVRVYKHTNEDHLVDAEEAAISSKVSKMSRGRFDIDPGFKGTQHVLMVGSPQVSTCEKLCKVLSCVDPAAPKVKSVKFEVEFHNDYD